jgi:hypothetical protein
VVERSFLHCYIVKNHAIAESWPARLGGQRAKSLPVKEQSACHFRMWYMPMHWAELIACIVSIWKKIFYCFIKQPRLSFLSCNHFQFFFGGGVTTAFYGWPGWTRAYGLFSKSPIPTYIHSSKDPTSSARLDIDRPLRWQTNFAHTMCVCFSDHFSSVLYVDIKGPDIARKKSELSGLHSETLLNLRVLKSKRYV